MRKKFVIIVMIMQIALEMHATDLSTPFHSVIKCSVKYFYEFMGLLESPEIFCERIYK